MAKYGKGKVYGTIVDAKGKAMKGVKVDLWDSDVDDDDWMGKTITNASGGYSMRMPSGMDHRVQGLTSFRPDIYVTASVKNRKGRWVKVGPKSKTYNNHKLKNNKKINLKLQTAAPQKKRTSFRVDKYAFKFKNNFIVEDILGIEGRWEMAFCGGMSAAALHRFQKKGCAVPATKTPPKDGTKLHEELFQRQIATLDDGTLAKIFDWQTSPDLPHAHRSHSIRFRQKAEWRALKALIDQGKPAVLVLVREEGYVADITKNHQVLAIGYEYNPTNRDLKVEVYDPNDKGGSNYLYLCLGGGHLKAEQFDSSNARINFRGFFVNSAGYEAAKDCTPACTKVTTKRRPSPLRKGSRGKRRVTRVKGVPRHVPTGTHPK